MLESFEVSVIIFKNIIDYKLKLYREINHEFKLGANKRTN